MQKKIYVSDVITEDIVENLYAGNNYLIASEMSSGKNYWMRNVLLPYALENNKRTLCLSHRRNTLDQQLNYLEEYKWECVRQFKGGMFDLKTYQTFQNMVKRNDPELSRYDYIVCDEAHYFVSDSSFNTKTELVFDFLNDNENGVKIFMTGTSNGLYYLPWKMNWKFLKKLTTITIRLKRYIDMNKMKQFQQ
ncbi:DEAD/DEAH box helicase family protein [Halobacillus rhizosphaerae]|uniref:DEAD/DEAH box helicase family protein n=1 Tax=Halobacillus rhizosphaerae TaxID=3064889 RepID=UPI00398B6DA4